MKKLVKNCDFSSSLWYNATGVSNEEEEKMKQKKENNGKTEEDSRTVLRGELALLIVVLINSLGVVLMLQSGSGISAISSVPYAFSLVLPKLSLGTWTYIFQGLLVVSLMILQKRFVPSISSASWWALPSAKCWMYINYGSTAFRWDLAGSFCISW